MTRTSALEGPRPEPITLRVPRLFCVQWILFFRPEGAPPSREYCETVVARWLALRREGLGTRGGGEPVEMEDLVFDVARSREFARLALGAVLFRGAPADATERFSASTHCVRIVAMVTPALLERPLYAGMAAGRALVDALEGVLLDAAASRFLSTLDCERALVAGGRARVVHHVTVPVSMGTRGLLWATTAGMGKFGLPELEVRDVPPGLGSAAALLLNATGQHLAERVAAAARSESDGDGVRVAVGPELRLDPSFVAAASGLESRGVRRGEVVVGLERSRERGRGSEPFIRVRPPGGSTRVGDWLRDARERHVRGRVHDRRAGER